MAQHDPATVASYELELPIQAKRDVVWEALTVSINEWWLPDFRILGPDSRVELDPVLGGHIAEHGADGAALVWYTVQMVVPGKSLHLVGHIAPAWGGPTLSMLQLKLEATDEGTVLKISDALVGVMSETQLTSLQSGWKQLFGDGLAAWVTRVAQ